MTTILLIALIATLFLAVQPDRARFLATEVRLTSVGLALLGATTQAVGLQVGARLGHMLVTVSMVALLGAAWSLRRWPGRWLLVLGVGLNAVAMMTYGRMPITPDVLAQFHITYPVGHMLAGSKDLVAQGAVASWFGDRFVFSLPFWHGIIVWSVGDLILLSGICRAALAKVPA